MGKFHGNICQPQRIDTLKRFREDQIDVLLATDVAARGLDSWGVKMVIIYTMPTTLVHYIHRVGRAAAACRSMSILGEGVRKIAREIVKRAESTASPSLSTKIFWRSTELKLQIKKSMLPE